YWVPASAGTTILVIGRALRSRGRHRARPTGPGRRPRRRGLRSVRAIAVSSSPFHSRVAAYVIPAKAGIQSVDASRPQAGTRVHTGFRPSPERRLSFRGGNPLPFADEHQAVADRHERHVHATVTP